MNLENFWDKEKIKANKNKINRVFFYRICGMGMGTTATLFIEAGYEVAGCDMAFYPPMGDYLKKMGVTCYKMEQVSAAMLAGYDLVVVGNSVSANTFDSGIIENCGTPFTSFPCVLGELILADRDVIGVAGTHGKTTTTYYLTQMLCALGEDVGYLVGGVLTDREASKLGKSDYFIIESDEYDSSYFQKFSKFRQYHIDRLVLTSLEYDHADIFKTVEDIEKQFEFILPEISQMISNSDYEAGYNVSQKLYAVNPNADQKSFGFNSQIGPHAIEEKGGFTHFKLSLNGKMEDFKTNIIGRQNILNITASVLFCLGEGFPLAKVKETLLSIKNVKRRQENRGKYKNAIVIDDFAHHPTAITLTLDGIKKSYPNQKISVVFEATTSTSRSSAFQIEFSKVFGLAEKVVVVNPKLPTNATQYDNMDYTRLTRDINSEGVAAVEVREFNHLMKEIDSITEAPGLLVILGNRTILGLWESDFVKKLVK
jgi:UDP-N-acetylmuramate: L-alanyl-gamma-D-glutamyl-meso-diaminopimelate ligase